MKINKKLVEQELFDIINPKDSLLECRIRELDYEVRYTLMAEIRDSAKNVYKRFSIDYVYKTHEAMETVVKEEMLLNLKAAILKWAVFGETNPMGLSLLDAINTAKVFKYNGGTRIEAVGNEK